MKRDEMVKELAKYLYNDWSITEGKDHRIPLVTSDDIIDFLEKSGMRYCGDYYQLVEGWESKE